MLQDNTILFIRYIRHVLFEIHLKKSTILLCLLSDWTKESGKGSFGEFINAFDGIIRGGGIFEENNSLV